MNTRRKKTTSDDEYIGQVIDCLKALPKVASALEGKVIKQVIAIPRGDTIIFNFVTED